MAEQKITRFDELLFEGTKAALVMRQPMKPVEGDNAVIYPPTFAGIGYNIDPTGDSETVKNVCLVDSVGSQANRMEPIFQKQPYSDLVPQVTVEVRKPASKGQDKGELIDTVDLLEAGHRIADAVVRFSSASDEIKETFYAVEKGNAEPLAKLAPTSLVFGCWDSRGSYVKLPRIVRSTIRATNVHKLTRSAQYVPAIGDYEDAIEKLSDKERKKFADAGMGHVPSTEAPGGVLLDENSTLLREAVLSLSALRALRAEDDEQTKALRRYIFGLSLIAFTTPQNTLLRMGCELTGDPGNPACWELVCCDGTREAFEITHDQAVAYAKSAADAFGVGECQTYTFDPKKAKEALKEKDKKGED